MSTGYTDKQISDAVNAYRFKYAGNEHALGKHYEYFTSSDIAKIDSEMLRVLRSLMGTERSDITDKMLPINMDRAEFTRTVLRELSRRGEVGYPYTAFPTNKPELQNKPVSVNRFPFYVQGAENGPVTEKAGVVVIRDGFVDIAQNNSAGIRLISDVGAQLGIKGGRQYPLENDAQAFDFGYAVGAQSAFRKDDNLQLTLRLTPTREQSARILALEDALKEGKTKAQIDAMRSTLAAEQKRMADAYVQQDHCAEVAQIFQPGRAHPNNNAMVRGFVQARVDSRTGFEPSSDRIGIYGECRNQRAQSR